jgi:thiosulfate reductase cytochrome b subunit
MFDESESNSLRTELNKESSILYKRIDYLVLFLILVITGILKWEHANLPFFGTRLGGMHRP